MKIMLHTIGVYFVAVGILSNIYAFFFGGYNVPADKHACQLIEAKPASTVIEISSPASSIPCSHTPTEQT